MNMEMLKNLTEAIVRNWAPKVICLTLALFLFLFYRISTLETKTLVVPIKIENANVLTPAAPYLKTARVSLRGERDKVYAITENNVSPYIDISSVAQEGEAVFPVKLRLSGNAASVDPLDITVDPTEITVVLEAKATKTLPISSVLIGFPEEGYSVVSSTLNPHVIEVSGPSSLVAGLSELKTEPISLAGLNSNVDGTISVVSPGELFSFEQSSTVSYRLSLAPEISEHHIEEQEIVFSHLIDSLEVETTPVTGSLVISGLRPDLLRWTPPPTLLSVSCSEITEPGSYTLDVSVNIPQEFSIVSLDPQTITIIVRERQEPPAVSPDLQTATTAAREGNDD